jgi:hypothetical protein
VTFALVACNVDGPPPTDPDALPQDVVNAPANPAQPSDPTDLPSINENANPAPDISLNRGMEMPDIIEPGDSVTPGETSTENPAPLNSVVRFEDGTGVSITQAGIVQGITLQTSLSTFDGVEALNPDRDYVFVRAEVTGVDNITEAVTFRTQLAEFDTNEVSPMPMDILAVDADKNLLYLVSESPITDDFFLDVLQIIGPQGLVTAYLGI